MAAVGYDYQYKASSKAVLGECLPLFERLEEYPVILEQKSMIELNR